MISLFKNWYLRHFSTPGTIEFALVLLCIFLIVYYFMWLVGPLVVALCIAYCLDGVVRFLTRKCYMSRTVASSVTMLFFIGLSVSILVFVVPKLLQQGSQFYQTLQSISAQNISTEKGEDFDSIVTSNILPFVENLPDPLPSMMTEGEIKELVNKARLALISNVSNIFNNQIMPSVVNVMSFLVYLVIVPIFTFLMLSNKSQLQSRFVTYILPSNQRIIHEFWPQLTKQIEGYMRGKLIHITIVSIVNTVAFMLFGLHYAILLGIGVGLSVVIPYVGAVIITIPILLVSVFQFGFGYTLVWLLAVYIIIQLLDSNVLTPMLFSKAMNLDAFSILASILIFGGLWGFWGVFFSIPLATFIRTIIVNWPSSSPVPLVQEEKK
ncbi:AI-2E family transporter [Succinivibrio faecicola]|uniref:AI-2E family transporter n=2 Tax=Succinivibrio TaxID=83770 RepID=A0ABS7DI61_9GAMM|nr:AI-2E family transporter [Succinivibrio faecicola]MBW7570226.1 AI-2E family transporter [Succinivibrio faecicola]MCI6939278.1 AI-2E family transporter [Succinatimonas hippei]